MPPRSPGLAGFPRQALPMLDFLLPWARPASTVSSLRSVGSSRIRRMAHAAAMAKDERDPLGEAQDREEAQFVVPIWTPTAMDRKGKGRAIELPVRPHVHSRTVAAAVAAQCPPEPSRSHACAVGASSSSTGGFNLVSSSSASSSSSTNCTAPGQTDISMGANPQRSPRPPDPKELLAKMRSGESLLTLDNGVRLARYAERMSDLRTAREVRDLIGRSRLAPLSWARSRSRAASRGSRSRRLALAHSMEVAGTEGLDELASEGADPMELGSAPQARETMGATTIHLQPSLKTKRPRTNQTLAHLWPPRLSTLTPRASVHDYLCHLHASLLPAANTKRPTLQHALSALNVLEPTPTAYHLRAVLHLFLAYPPGHAYSPTSLASGRWSREIAHLLDDLATRYPQFEPGHQTLLLSILPFTRDYRTLPFPRGTRTGILRMIKHFQDKWRRAPTMETWRYIGRWSAWAKDEKLAKLAWEGWWQEGAKREAVPSADPSTRNRWDILRPEQQVASLDRRTIETTPVSNPGTAFVFERRGRLLLRWRKVAVKFAGHGWLVHRDTGDRVSAREKIDLKQLAWREGPGGGRQGARSPNPDSE